MTALILHPAIRKRIDSYTDLVPARLHAFWPHVETQFVNNLLNDGYMTSHKQFFSPHQHRFVGFWHFSRDKIPAGMAIPETTLYSLGDDMTAELATWIAKSRPQDNEKKGAGGFTVNLNITKTGESPPARSFFFEAWMSSNTDKTAVIEAAVFDAETNVKLIVVRGTFLSVSFDMSIKKSGIATGAEHTVPSPLLDASDAEGLSKADLATLSRLMDFLPHNSVTTDRGALSRSTKCLVTTLGFGPNLTGPVIYIHGGVLGTVLYNAAAMLFQLLTGKSPNAVNWDITYKSPVPIESIDNVITAQVKSESAQSVTIFSKIMRGSKVFTTLTTVFSLGKLEVEQSKL